MSLAVSLVRGICGLLLWSGGHCAIAADEPTGGLVLGDLQVARAILDADQAAIVAGGPPPAPASGAHRTQDWLRASDGTGAPDDVNLYSRHPYQALLTQARSAASGDLPVDESVLQAALRVRF